MFNNFIIGQVCGAEAYEVVYRWGSQNTVFSQGWQVCMFYFVKHVHLYLLFSAQCDIQSQQWP